VQRTKDWQSFGDNFNYIFCKAGYRASRDCLAFNFKTIKQLIVKLTVNNNGRGLERKEQRIVIIKVCESFLAAVPAGRILLSVESRRRAVQHVSVLVAKH